MLVFSSDLKQVEEIGGGCADLDQILVCLRDGVGQVGYGHVLRTVEVLFHLYGSHCDVGYLQLQAMYRGNLG